MFDLVVFGLVSVRFRFGFGPVLVWFGFGFGSVFSWGGWFLVRFWLELAFGLVYNLFWFWFGFLLVLV